MNPFGTNTCPDRTIKKKLNEASDWPFSCGFSRVAQHTESGEATGFGMPWELQFETTDTYRNMFDSAKEFDATTGAQVSWMTQMGRIPTGSDLFTVYAWSAPIGTAQAARINIGTIRLSTRMRTSRFGDETLFYAHMRRDSDQQFFPAEWRRADAAIDPRTPREDPANIWTHGVPAADSAGGWPSDDAGA